MELVVKTHSVVVCSSARKPLSSHSTVDEKGRSSTIHIFTTYKPKLSLQLPSHPAPEFLPLCIFPKIKLNLNRVERCAGTSIYCRYAFNTFFTTNISSTQFYSPAKMCTEWKFWGSIPKRIPFHTAFSDDCLDELNNQSVEGRESYYHFLPSVFMHVC